MKQKQLNTILSAVIIFLLIVVAGVVFYFNSKIDGTIFAVLRKSQVQVARQFSEAFKEYIQAMGGDLKVLASFETIKKRLPGKMGDEVNSFFEYVRMYFINAISVFNERGEVIYSTMERAIREKYGSYEFWKESMESRGDNLVYVSVIVVDTMGKNLFKKLLSLILFSIYDGGKFQEPVAYTIEIDSLINSFLELIEPGVKLYDTWIISSDDKIFVFHSARTKVVLRRAELKELAQVPFIFRSNLGRKGSEINRGEEKMQKIGQGYKTLVIEDEESLRIIMRDYLEMLGFNVILAEDGESGIKKFVENPDVKIVFVDYGLPKVMGDEVIRRIKSISDDVKFILITGFVDVSDAVKNYLPSGTKFIRKPYNLSQVEEIVKEFLLG